MIWTARHKQNVTDALVLLESKNTQTSAHCQQHELVILQFLHFKGVNCLIHSYANATNKRTPVMFNLFFISLETYTQDDFMQKRPSFICTRVQTFGPAPSCSMSYDLEQLVC